MTFALSRDGFLEGIAAHHRNHGHDDPWWIKTNQQLGALRRELEDALRSGGVALDSIGHVPMSYVDMGAITSVDLFGLDELIILSFYWINRHRYRRVIDMGANVGLHSVVLGMLGLRVDAYEPDPRHTLALRGHLDSAGVQSSVRIHEAAITPHGGVAEFVRVVGNTTGSHVAGAKSSPYGTLERFDVAAVAVSDAIRGADLVKMDVEGLEADLISTISEEDLCGIDVICEVGSPSNAERIWRHLERSTIRMFPQKIGWRLARSVADLPTSYHEGSLFLSMKEGMPWK